MLRHGSTWETLDDENWNEARVAQLRKEAALPEGWRPKVEKKKPVGLMLDAAMDAYPLSPYLTQLVVRVLQSRESLVPELEETVRQWAWAQLAKQLALVQSKSKTKDTYAVVYLLMLVAAVTYPASISPEQAGLQRAALEAVFDGQLDPTGHATARAGAQDPQHLSG